MNIFFGILLLVGGGACVAGATYWFLYLRSNDINDVVDKAMGYGLDLALFLGGAAVVGFAFIVLTGGAAGPDLAVGACYRAVQTNSYVPITTNKTTIIVPTHGVDLVLIACPS